MRKYFLLLSLLVAFITANGQNHGVVKAEILDSLTRQPVQLATVSILKLQDTSLLSYTITDKKGEFALHNLRQEPSRLLISHVGYQTIHLTVDFKKGDVVDLGRIYLSAKTLQEVVVKGERIPVMMRKDTLEFDAMAFKTRPNALVEDLLKKLPGIQVDFNGTITVNGKAVSKIKVNGKDFFVNDQKIATRELEANMISKVQVYDDRENDPDHLVPDFQVKKIINLKFKKSFTKGVLSTLSAGAGTQDRYIASGFAAKFQDDQQLSVRLNSDNLSGTGTFIGNYGGFNNWFLGSTGIKKSTTGNFDFTQDITKKLKLHIEYRFDNSISDNNSNSKIQQNINDTVINTLSQDIRHQKVNNQTLHAETEWKPDTLTIIKFTPDIDYSYNNSLDNNSSVKSNTYIPLLNTSLSSDHSTSTDFTYQHSFSYYRKLSNAGASITIGSNIGVHPTHSNDFNDNELISYVSSLASDTLNRYSKNTNNDVSESVNAAYHLPITKKLSADIIMISLHDHNRGDLLTYQQDLKTGLYTIYLQDQSSDLTRNLFGESLTPQLTYNFTDNIYFKAGLNGLAQQIGNHFSNSTNDLNQNFFYLFPSAELRVKDFTLGYSESVQQPSINNLQPITIVYSPLYTFIGNPDLKPTYFHNISLDYHKYNYQSKLNINVNSRIIIESNTIVNQQSLSPEGASVTTPINRNGRFTAYLNGSFSKSFKKQGKWEFLLIGNMSASAGHNFFIVNQQNGYQNTQTLSVNPIFSAEWNNLISFQPTYSINYNVTQYQFVNYPKSSYTTQTAGMVVDLSAPKDFRWRINYNYNYNPVVAPGFQRSANLLNLSVTKHIQKNQAEIGLVGYDLLNQSTNFRHFVVGNTINDVQNQMMRRYVLLTYTYHFRKFK